MGDTLPRFTAAAVQAAPVFLDREATIDKACELIADAGDAGADLIVFPETWIPGYPFWHSTPGVFSGETFAELWKNAVEIPSLATARLAEAAAPRARLRRHRHQRARHRQPRHAVQHACSTSRPKAKSRTATASSCRRSPSARSGASATAATCDVLDTPLGRIGGLICWEHEMTLAKYALYAQGEQVHCATWPAYTAQNNHIDFGMRQYAFEGACFVVSACGVVTPGSLPERLGGDKRPRERRQRHHRPERRLPRRPRLRPRGDPLRRDRPRGGDDARSTRATSPGTTRARTSSSSS